MGQRVGCGAHLESLRRTASGEFALEDAHTFEEIEAGAKRGMSKNFLYIPASCCPACPGVTASEEAAAYLRNGRAVKCPEFSSAPMVKVFGGQREIIAIATRVAARFSIPRLCWPMSRE